VKKSTIPNAGLGLFATRDLPRGTQIPYEGKKLTDYQEKKMYGSATNDVAPYGVSVKKNLVVDGACARGTANFSNDNPKKRNAKLIATKGEVKITSTKKIKKGQEVFTNYGKEYFPKPNTFPKPSFKTSKNKLTNVLPLPPKKKPKI
jgi:hypothetical protein